MMKVIAHVINLVNVLVNVLTDPHVLVVVADMAQVKLHGHLAILPALKPMLQNLIKVTEPHGVMIIVPPPQLLEVVVIKGEILVQKDNPQDIKVVHHVNQDNLLATKVVRHVNQDNLQDIKVVHHVNQDNLQDIKVVHHVNQDSPLVTKEKDLATKAEITRLKSVILNFIF